jgi:antitoxin MazE
MQVAKWGNSLAVRIPADVVRQLGLKEGDTVSLRAAEADVLEVVPDARRARLIEEITRLSVPFPHDFRFDRDEANAR